MKRAGILRPWAVFVWLLVWQIGAMALDQQILLVSPIQVLARLGELALQGSFWKAVGFSMLRVMTGISILWFLIPGYIVALVLTFFVPDIYTAIAFDSGGVASGPMTATFMLQFMIGASMAWGGNVLTDAFGLVAMVAMMPLLSIQMVGFLYERKKKTIV